MPSTRPYVPTNITVHLGLPDEDAPNVTVPFREYVYNVASSEIYPTWNESAIRANILAIISYALNRVYTEYYPSRGYDFNITNTTQYDQKYIHGRNYFDSVVRITDELFDNYIRRKGFIEPLAAAFCNGTTSVCDGLSQWGSQELAQQGFDSLEILRRYYGTDIELVTNAPIQDFEYSYPGKPLRLGSSGQDVVIIQASLNQVAEDYPAIPKISPVDGIFGPETEQSVRTFQEAFQLTPDGIVGKSTWYKLVQLYVAIRNLNELTSQGQQYVEISPAYQDVLSEGDSGTGVTYLQYMLGIVAQFIAEIPPLSVTGFYDRATRDSVLAFQRFAGLQPSGVVGTATWTALYDQFRGIEKNVLEQGSSLPPFPGITLQKGMQEWV